MPVNLYAQRESVLAAVSADGSKLQDFPYWTDDEGIVRAAISNYGKALKWASERLKGKWELVSLAMCSTPGAIGFAPLSIQRFHFDSPGRARKHGPLTEKELAIRVIRLDPTMSHEYPQYANDFQFVAECKR